MDALNLPADKAHFALRVTLDDRDYTLSLEWSQREAKWYLALADQDENPILRGIKVVADYPLLTLAKWDARCPPGQLIANDTSGQGLDPGFADMTGASPRVVLTYVTGAELG